MKIAKKNGHKSLKNNETSGDLVSSSETFGARLYKILGGEAARTFALRANLTPAAFHKYLKCQSEPTRPVLNAIAEAAGVSLDWLLTGRGPMHKEDVLLAAPESQAFTVKNLEGHQAEFKLSPKLCHLPILDLHSSCDPSVFIAGDRVCAVLSASRNWIRRKLDANPDDLSLVLVDGDSMSDTIKPEDIVIVDRSKVVSPCDGVWTFFLEAGVFIKRLQFMPGKTIKVKSDNPLYETYNINSDNSLRLLGQVIATLPFKRL